MIIDINKLPKEGLLINQIIDFDSKKYNSPRIDQITSVKVSGKIYYGNSDELIIELEAKGEMVLKDAIDLTPITYPFEIIINEKGSSIEQNDQNQQNLLDIIDILWQNVLLEVPIKITKPENENISLHGDGWELLNENTKKIDSRLAPLLDLLEKGKD